MEVLRPQPEDDVHAYWQSIRDLWAAGEPFAIVEHDVIIPEGQNVLERFETCPGPWCFNSYAVPANAHAYQAVEPGCAFEGCGRLGDDHPVTIPHPFQATNLACVVCGATEHAEIFAVQIADLGGSALGCSRFRPADLPDVFADVEPVHWANLDVHISSALRVAGFIPHRHAGNVGHGLV